MDFGNFPTLKMLSEFHHFCFASSNFSSNLEKSQIWFWNFDFAPKRKKVAVGYQKSTNLPHVWSTENFRKFDNSWICVIPQQRLRLGFQSHSAMAPWTVASGSPCTFHTSVPGGAGPVLGCAAQCSNSGLPALVPPWGDRVPPPNLHTKFRYHISISNFHMQFPYSISMPHFHIQFPYSISIRFASVGSSMEPQGSPTEFTYQI